MGLITSETLATLASESKTEKLLEHDLINGQKIEYMVIRRKRRGVFAFPRWERKQNRKKPFLLIWKEETETHYAWYDLLIGEVYRHDKYKDSDFLPCAAYHLHPYYMTPIEEYNEDQGDAIIEQRYSGEHTALLDVHSHDEYIFTIYRDRYTRKRHRGVIFGFEWYFYIRLNDTNKMMAVLDKTARGMIRRTEVENDWLRVYCDNRNYRGYDRQKKDPAAEISEQLRGRVDTFEADLDPAARYVTDKNVEVDSNVRKLWFDIETDDRQRGIEVGRDQILCIAAIDCDDNIFYKVTNNEKQLLNWLFDLVMDYDIIIGFNSYNFDGEYLKLRAKTPHRIYWAPNYRNVRVGHVDIMRRIIGTFGRHDTANVRSFSLNNLAKVFLKKSKLDIGTGTYDLFINNRKLLKEYNIMDVKLTKELDEKLGITDLMVAMCKWTGMFPTSFKPTSNLSGISVSRLLDSFILRKAKSMGVHYRTAVWEKNADERYVGGLVMEPDPGLYEDVYVLDFKSLYPSIIWSWKISPENWKKRGGFKTKEETIVSAAKFNDKHPEFYKHREAVFPLLVDDLMADRKEFKVKMGQVEEGSLEYQKYDIMQKMTKELTNALYGQLGQQGNRYYAVELASSITVAGRKLMLETKRLLEDRGIKVFYGDTDSVFITNLGSYDIHEIMSYINTTLPSFLKNNYNIDKSIIEIEYEKRFGKFVIVGGKNYAGRLVELDNKPSDKVIFKGIECVKKSTIEIAKRNQEKMVETILRKDYGASYYLGQLLEIKQAFYAEAPKLDDIIIRTAISKNPSEYAKKTPHVRVAEQMIKEKKEFWVGMQIPYVMVDKKNKIAVHADDYDGKFDRDEYWDKIYTPLARILKVCFKDVDWDARFKISKTKKKTDPNQTNMLDSTLRIEPKKPNVDMLHRAMGEVPVKRRGKFVLRKSKNLEIADAIKKKQEESTCSGCGNETILEGGVCYNCSSNDGYDKAVLGVIHPTKIQQM